MAKTWRDYARPIIAKVLEVNKNADERATRKALKAAYPFGERKYHPYKIWLSEIQVQLNKKTLGKKKNIVPKEQGKLF